jgi:hypothetical protein
MGYRVGWEFVHLITVLLLVIFEASSIDEAQTMLQNVLSIDMKPLHNAPKHIKASQ